MQYLRIDPRSYPNPTNKALDSARNLKSQQRTTPERYEEYRGEPAPAWMRASAEEIAKHIDMVHYFATIHGVQLKWEHVEYGISNEAIEDIAIAKKSHKYMIGDILPREAEVVRVGESRSVHNYHGVYYIAGATSNAVRGVYLGDFGEYRFTANNLTRENIIAVRFASESEAREIAFQDEIVSEWVKGNTFVNSEGRLLSVYYSSEQATIHVAIKAEEESADDNFDLFTFMDAVKYRHLKAIAANGKIKVGNAVFSQNEKGQIIIL